ncbi:helix-turn-helix domain-containing protein [Mesosutterella sp. OilRF-GAM-744-9]|uniref:Helix-turn-helix domain-containing protein n=1 Tax=Mesosutterella porci TaxID=2915351 RepID=A0ABS9MTC8_9BURK|nr:helix-turn-helix domain-containing protein [Mesosutterella sp. oilRF-744-WT-GAM-9]MCG5031876.1 helix-turn-helix domain-containing protein [Mesosutterella sp. oilRF-744-WT-GAM-9]
MDQWLGIAATRKAWEANVKTSTQRLMLLALAKYSDDKCTSFPSVPSLCADTLLNRKTVFKVLKELKEMGFISVEKRPNNGNKYLIQCSPKNGTTENGTTENGTTENGTTENGTTENGTTGSPKNGTSVVPKTGHEEYQLTNQLTDKEALPPSPPPARRKTAFPCPPEINPEAWDAWMQVRKAKRTGGITKYGWKLFCNQAAKAGLTPAQAIDLCIERGWQGFKAEWLKREQEPEDDFKRMGRQERERQRLAKQQGQAPAPSSKPASEPQNHDDEIYEELNGLF